MRKKQKILMINFKYSNNYDNEKTMSVYALKENKIKEMKEFFF